MRPLNVSAFSFPSTEQFGGAELERDTIRPLVPFEQKLREPTVLEQRCVLSLLNYNENREGARLNGEMSGDESGTTRSRLVCLRTVDFYEASATPSIILKCGRIFPYFSQGFSLRFHSRFYLRGILFGVETLCVKLRCCDLNDILFPRLLPQKEGVMTK